MVSKINAQESMNTANLKDINKDYVINSPFKWVGGKSRLKKKIVSLLPPHECYIEVFGGAGWVLFEKTPSKVEIFNDIDGDVINFFRIIKQRPQDFINSFKWTLVSRQEFKELCDQNTDNLSDLQRAYRFFYLVMASWGGEFGNPRFQISRYDGGHGNRLIGAIKDLYNRIMPVYERLQTVIIEELDWREVIKKYDKPVEGKEIIMYLDPPYPGNNCNYKFNMRRWEDHIELVNALKTLNSKFILTSYDLPEIRELYKGYQMTQVDFAAGMPSAKNNRSRNREIIVTNYDNIILE